MGKLTKTLVLGGLIAGAVAVLTKTKKGKQLQKQLLGHVGDLYETLEKRLDKIKNITQDKYEDAVDAVVDAYVEGKRLTKAEATAMRKELKKKWEDYKAEMEI